MQIVYHMGVHQTDGDRMFRTLAENAERLRRDKVEVADPHQFAPVLSETLMSLNGGTASPDMQNMLIDALISYDDTERMILSTPQLLGTAPRAFGSGGLYPQAAARVSGLMNLFGDMEAEFFMSIINPATLLGTLYNRLSLESQKAIEQVDPATLRWGAVIGKLKQILSGRRFVVWCHEDSPMIWPEIARLMADISPDTPLKAQDLMLNDLLTKRQRKTLGQQTEKMPVADIAGRRRMWAEYIAENAPAAKLEQEITIPGWTQETVDMVTENYYAELIDLCSVQGIEFVMP